MRTPPPADAHPLPRPLKERTQAGKFSRPGPPRDRLLDATEGILDATEHSRASTQHYPRWREAATMVTRKRNEDAERVEEDEALERLVKLGQVETTATLLKEIRDRLDRVIEILTERLRP